MFSSIHCAYSYLRLFLSSSVVDHYFHLINLNSDSQSYVICCTWLRASLQSAVDLLDPSSASAEGAKSTAPYGDNVLFSSSLCLPLFAAPSESASPHKNSGLAGVTPLVDLFAGHVILFRRKSGEVTIVNLSVHTKLYELQLLLEVGTTRLIIYKLRLFKLDMIICLSSEPSQSSSEPPSIENRTR